MKKITPEERKEAAQLENEKAADLYEHKPVLDTRRWFKDLYAKEKMPWQGPEPEEYSPKNASEERRFLKDVLFGRREPKTEYEARYLAFMGGVQTSGDEYKKFVSCGLCEVEFPTTGYPGASGARMYPTICVMCSDRMDARRRVSKPTRDWSQD